MVQFMVQTMGTNDEAVELKLPLLNVECWKHLYLV